MPGPCSCRPMIVHPLFGQLGRPSSSSAHLMLATKPKFKPCVTRGHSLLRDVLQFSFDRCLFRLRSHVKAVPSAYNRAMYCGTGCRNCPSGTLSFVPAGTKVANARSLGRRKCHHVGFSLLRHLCRSVCLHRAATPPFYRQLEGMKGHGSASRYLNDPRHGQRCDCTCNALGGILRIRVPGLA